MKTMKKTYQKPSMIVESLLVESEILNYSINDGQSYQPQLGKPHESWGMFTDSEMIRNDYEMRSYPDCLWDE